MPYSSDPQMYPAEMLTLVSLLEQFNRKGINQLLIPAAGRGEALTKKTQTQAFFAALGKHAVKMRALAVRVGDKKLKAAQLAAPTKDATAAPAARQKAIREIEEDSQDAEALAGIWEARFEVVSGWMVRTKEQDGKWFVEVARRTLGDFGKAMLEEAERLLATQPAAESSSTCGAQTTMPQTSEPITARPRIDDPAGALPPTRTLITEGSQPATDTTLEAQLALLRQAAVGLQPDNGR